MGAAVGRPWEADNIHPQTGLFDHYLRMSPWRDYVKQPKKRDRMFQIQRKLYELLPRPLYIPIHKAVLNRYLAQVNKEALSQGQLTV